jgi:branched-chain amino acid transport system substrate-binding protein
MRVEELQMSRLTSANGLKPRYAIALVITTLATGFLTAACQNTATSGGSSNTTADANTLKIVSSLPMTGSSLGQTQTIINGIKQVIEETKMLPVMARSNWYMNP